MFAKLDNHTAKKKIRVSLEFIKRPIYEFIVQKNKSGPKWLRKFQLTIRAN